MPKRIIRGVFIAATSLIVLSIINEWASDKPVTWFSMVVFIPCFVFLLFHFVRYYNSQKENRRENEKMRQHVNNLQ